MAQQLILDEDGEFFTNAGSFPFIDPSSGVRFEPGVSVKTKETEWLKGQPVLVKQVVEKPAKAAK